MRFLIFFLSPLFFLACEGFADLNESPVKPRSAHPSQLLTQVAWDAFRSFQGAAPLYASRMLVLTDTESAEQYYKWSRGCFAFDGLRNVQKMVEEALRVDEPAYLAIARLFRAHYFLHMTLTFGDIPYSQALRGESDGVDTPAYDRQADVFAGILAELHQADSILAAHPDADISGDIIYAGDLDKWRRLINAFRLKVLLTLSPRVADEAGDVPSRFAAIVATAPLFRSLSDDAALYFLDRSGNRYPEFNGSRYNSGIYMDSTFVRLLQEHRDPRLFVFCAPTKEAREAGKAADDFSACEGGDPIAPYDQVNAKAAQGKVSKVNARYYLNPTAEPLVLLGFAEQQFILAEAAVRGWTDGDPTALYTSGIRAAFRFYATHAAEQAYLLTDSAADAYLLDPLHQLDALPSPDERIAAIITQKYFQSFLQGKWTPYFDHLRTGYPSFLFRPTSPPPFRWMYPLSEYNTNPVRLNEALARQFAGIDDIHQPPWLFR